MLDGVKRSLAIALVAFAAFTTRLAVAFVAARLGPLIAGRADHLLGLELDQVL